MWHTSFCPTGGSRRSTPATRCQGDMGMSKLMSMGNATPASEQEGSQKVVELTEL